MAELNPPHTPRRRTPARTAPLIAAVVAGLLALPALGIGAAALAGDSEKDADGYLSTSSHRFATQTHALATAELDVDAGGSDWFVAEDRYGKIRLQVEAATDEPVFVGIARTSEVDAYLGGTDHTEVTDVGYDPFEARYRQHVGDRRPTAPTEQRFWEASTLGSGEQTLDWDVENGSWSIVVMNADGSAGVDVDVSAGANVPVLATIGWIGLGTGLLLALSAGGLLYVSLRSSDPRPHPMPPVAVTA